MTFEEACVALATKTGMSPTDWSDFLQCTADQQRALVRAYSDMSWTKSRDTLNDVLAVLQVLGTVAGVVSGVGTAISVIAALRSV